MKKVIILLAAALIITSGYAQFRKKDIFDYESVKMSLLPVNSERSDFGPALIGDSLYYTSFNKKENRKLRIKGFYDLFCSAMDENGNLSEEGEALREFSKSYHNGPVSWCKATKELFITQSNTIETGAQFRPFRKDYFNLQIIIAKSEEGIWKTAEEFPYNNPKFSVGHPAVSITGDTLIFTSNKAGGFGETDLYMSIRKNGKWEEPVNLGNKINSIGKDEFPFLTSNGDLVFASSGRDGLGGLDIYYTRLDDPESKIYHFDRPINSEYDDFSMVISPERGLGYMASNRWPGIGEDDIYFLTFKVTKSAQLDLLVLDSGSLRPIVNAEVSFTDNINLKTGNNGKISRQITEDYFLDVNVKAAGYVGKYKSIKTDFISSGSLIQDTVFLDKLIVHQLKEKLVLRNIYFDYDRWDILPESKDILDNLSAYLIEKPLERVYLSAHADSRGTKEYNKILSDKRLSSVVDYLLSKGITSDRIIANSYGESIPFNECVDLVICSPQELRMNRRVEFFTPSLGQSESVDQKGKGDFSTEMKEAKQENEKSHTLIRTH